MKRLLLSLGLLLATIFHTVQSQTNPPLAPARPVVEDYCGVSVEDPYRYMENMDEPEVQAWFKAQSNYARATLDNIAGRQRLIDKMREFDKRRTVTINYFNITENDRYFYLRTTPEDETGKLYYRDGFEGKEHFLFDPEKWEPERKQKFTISSLSPSWDGKLIAFELAPNGSESSVMYIMDVEKKKLLPEQFDRCWFASPSWLSDNSGFFYNRLQSDDVHHLDREKDSKTWLHRLGTHASADVEMLSREHNPELGILPEEFPVIYFDKYSNYLFAMLYTVDKRMKAYYAPFSDFVDDGQVTWKPLFKQADELVNFWCTDKDIYAVTFKDAPTYKIVKTPLARPDFAHAETVVPENAAAPLEPYSLSLAKDALYFSRTKNGVEAKVYRMPYGSNKPVEINLPLPAGTAWVQTKGAQFEDAWIGLSGWTTQYSRYRYLPATGELRHEQLSTQAKYPEFDDLVVEEITVPSHDGVQVPLSLIYKKGLKKDGSTPVYLWGYGAYGASMSPWFNPMGNLLLASEGVVIACAHVRGGGELGDAWHKAGKNATKPNTWKDFITCAEYLVKEKYTSPKKIAIWSASAGGILVGRAMTERPDLFAAAMPDVGCLNALRMEFSPNGPVNAPEFGTLKDPEECKALMEMDAYLHIKKGVNYPATLVTAGMNDPRVIAWQPAKFAARLQADNASSKPVLFFCDYEAGHGIGDTKTKQFEATADMFSFGLWQTGQPGFELKQKTKP